MTIDAHCSQVSHAHHVAPIWQATPESERGTFTAGPHAVGWLREHGIEATVSHIPPDSVTPTLVGSFPDLMDCRGRPLALAEHGVGITYAGLDSGGYAGGAQRDGVSLFLCPSERVAKLNADRYPDARVEVVGSPRLDEWHGRKLPTVDPPVVAVSFHWAHDFPIPEGRPAWTHYVKSLPDWKRIYGDRLIGHGHPRGIQFYRRTFDRYGIEVVPDFDEVMERCDVFATDISSSGFEAAAIGRGVVWLNCPDYRQDVEQSVRFWSHVGVGVQCNTPGQFPLAVEAAQTPPAGRGALLDDVLPLRDGQASQRAADALVEWSHHALPWSERPVRHGRSR